VSASQLSGPSAGLQQVEMPVINQAKQQPFQKQNVAPHDAHHAKAQYEQQRQIMPTSSNSAYKQPQQNLPSTNISAASSAISPYHKPSSSGQNHTGPSSNKTPQNQN